MEASPPDFLRSVFVSPVRFRTFFLLAFRARSNLFLFLSPPDFLQPLPSLLIPLCNSAMAKHASKGERALRKRSETKPTRSRKLKRIACLHHRSHTLSSAESQDSLQKFECEVPSLVSLQSSVSGSFYEEAAVSSDCSSRSNSVPMTFASRDRKILARNQREESKKIVMRSDSMDTRRITALRSCKNSTHKEVQAMLPATNDRLVRESTPSSNETHIEDQRSCNKLFGKCHESRPPSAAFAGRVAEADIEDFFRGAEQQQRLRFVERYNFDPVNERPLPGRYEWASMQDHHP